MDRIIRIGFKYEKEYVAQCMIHNVSVLTDKK